MKTQNNPTPTTPTTRFIRLPELSRQTGQTRSSIYNITNPKSPYYDPDFPKPYRIGMRSIAWMDSEVQAWINSRLCARGVAL